ncbi:hypothetical protein [Natrinema ejinorense]|uniref:Uncharacterized protein n=1 Tax=Natrinema ejinorense TaxID=373386 RepID=A0A2A5QR15_9EURY|nr:hypothetical protein [Natrinema ejinorense]PCR89296.1 hypothetical protein CP557_01335 [Natrinema ejinorense]
MSLQKEHDQTEAQWRKRSKEVYEALIRAVDHNSGHCQPPLAKKSSVIGTLHGAGYGRYGLEELRKAIRAACRNGDLFEVEDDEGRTRLGINDRWKLREKIETNLSRVDEPRADVIGLANQRIQQLRGDDDE